MNADVGGRRAGFGKRFELSADGGGQLGQASEPGGDRRQ